MELFQSSILVLTEHSTLFVRFYDIFEKVYGRIQYNDELINRLNEELIESDCKCFTGRITRLVNVLNGFFDDIQINISSSEQIGNIIKNIIRDKEEITDEMKNKIRQELIEREYNIEVIYEWINNI